MLCLFKWDVLDSGDRRPFGVGTMLSARSIALSCSGGIVWTTFVAIRATPLFLALRPALDPIGEGSIAIILGSRSFCVVTAVEGINRTCWSALSFAANAHGIATELPLRWR